MQGPQAGVIKAGCNGYGRRDKDRKRYLAGTSQAFQLVCIRWKRAPFPLTECTDSTGVLRMFILKNAFSALDVISFIFVERPRLAAMSCPEHRGPSLAASCLAVWQSGRHLFIHLTKLSGTTTAFNLCPWPVQLSLCLSNCPPLFRQVNRQTDRQTDGQTDRVVCVGIFCKLPFSRSCL